MTDLEFGKIRISEDISNKKINYHEANKLIYVIFEKFKSYSFWNIFLIICLITSILFLKSNLFYEESLKKIQTTNEYKKVRLNGAICNDGTYSYSQGSGTCSWHDGVYSYYKDVLIDTDERRKLLYIEYSKDYQQAYLFFIFSSLISLYFGRRIDTFIKNEILYKSQMIAEQAELEATRRAELEVKRQAELEAKRQVELEAKRQVELEAKRRAELEAKRQAELEAKRQAELEVKRQAELEAKRQAELEAKRQAELEAKRQAELEAKRRAELKAKKRAELKVKKRAELAIRRKIKKQEITQNLNIEEYSNWINHLTLNKKNASKNKPNFRNMQNFKKNK